MTTNYDNYEIVMTSVCKSKSDTHPDHGKPVVLVKFKAQGMSDRLEVGIGNTPEEALFDAIEKSKVPFLNSAPLQPDEI